METFRYRIYHIRARDGKINAVMHPDQLNFTTYAEAQKACDRFKARNGHDYAVYYSDEKGRIALPSVL